MESLFRKSALEYQRDKYYGSTLAVRPPSLAAIGAVGLIASAIVLAVLVTQEVPRREPFIGYTSDGTGTTRITAPFPGVIEDIYIRSGENVEIGTPILAIGLTTSVSDGRSAHKSNSEEADGQLRSLRYDKDLVELAQTQEASKLSDELTSLEDELENVERELLINQQIVSAAKTEEERMHQLATSSFVSHTAALRSRSDYLEKAAKLASLERTQKSIRRSIQNTTLQLRRSRIELSVRKNAIDRQISAIKQDLGKESAKQGIEILSRTSGTVTNVLLNRGDSVNEGDLLAMVRPGGDERHIVVLIPQAAIGQVKVGQQLAIRYRAFPYQKFGVQKAHLISISEETIPEGTKVGPLTLREPSIVARAALEIDALSSEIRSSRSTGLIVDGHILLERRRLWEWLLLPVIEAWRVTR